MQFLRFWQFLSLVLAGLCLWFGTGWHRAMHRAAEQSAAHPRDSLLKVGQARAMPRAAHSASGKESDESEGEDGRDLGAGKAASLQSKGVFVPMDLAVRVSGRIGPPLTINPPDPMKWDRDQLALLGLTDIQIDALNAAAARADEALLAELRRAIRPLKRGEHGQFPEMEEKRYQGESWQRFLIPDWQLIQSKGTEMLRQEVLSIAGPDAVARLFPAAKEYWAKSPFDRILSVQDMPESGWTIADELVSQGYTKLTNSTPGKELPAQWKALFQVADEPVPAAVGNRGD